MDELERLNMINKVKIHSVFSDEFKSYGRVLRGYDWSEMTDYMRNRTEVPAVRNVYVASVDQLEDMEISKRIAREVYGAMPVQVGYCNGNTHSYNGFEYHKCSEVNLAVTPMLLSLGHVWDMDENTYDTKKAEVFYIPEGTAIEIYGTTLHLAPHRLAESGFKAVVILPLGTNTPLDEEDRSLLAKSNGDVEASDFEIRDGGSSANRETEILFMTNKWIVCHPSWEPLVSQGVKPGVIGENIETCFE